MSTTDQRSPVIDAAMSGPPPIHKIKFETPPPYKGLKAMAWILEGIGSLMLIADFNILIGFWNPPAVSGAELITLMVTMLFCGALLVAFAEVVRLLIRMQHDAMRTREYMHYVAWSQLTQSQK